MRQATRSRARFLRVAVSALVCGVAADVLLVLPFALSSQAWRLWFAAFGVGALFAAITAGWVGTLVAADGTRSRLLLVVAVSEAVAAIVAATGFLGLSSQVIGSSALLPLLLILYFGLGMTVVALAGGWAALGFRGNRQRLVPDLLATLGLLALMVLVLVRTIVLAPLP